jgi:hypothetical protein
MTVNLNPVDVLSMYSMWVDAEYHWNSSARMKFASGFVPKSENQNLQDLDDRNPVETNQSRKISSIRVSFRMHKQ